MSKRKRQENGDVKWYLHKTSQRPFTTSTIAESNFIRSLGEEFDTVQEAYDAIMAGRFIKGEKTMEILEAFIDAGYGGMVLRENIR